MLGESTYLQILLLVKERSTHFTHEVLLALKPNVVVRGREQYDHRFIPKKCSPGAKFFSGFHIYFLVLWPIE